MKNIDALVISAMDEEMKPFRNLLHGCNLKSFETPVGTAYRASKGSMRMVMLVTNIGMAACASVLGWALSQYRPNVIVSIGSAGGLARDSRVGQVVVGAEYFNGGADGRAFGYERGQVPRQPVSFTGDVAMIDAINKMVAFDKKYDTDEAPVIRVGQMLSSDAFVTETNVGDTRQAFPDALSVDMESHAAAQVAHAWGIPFISIRGISDLCGDPDDQTVSFHAEVSSVAAAAAKTACYALQNSGHISLFRCSTARFSRPSLTSALLVMLARRYRLSPVDPASIHDDDFAALQDSMNQIDPKKAQELLGEIAAGYLLAQEKPESSLTAKDYDRLRAEFLESHPRHKKDEPFSWPPTSQTIIKRFDGYWNEALKAIGLVPRQGRTRGGIKYSAADYRDAISQFVTYAVDQGISPSIANYTLYTKNAGRAANLPSGAAVRQHFGSWSSALQNVL